MQTSVVALYKDNSRHLVYVSKPYCKANFKHPTNDCSPVAFIVPSDAYGNEDLHNYLEKHIEHLEGVEHIIKDVY